MKEVKIYIATHKKTQLPEKECYVPIQVGCEGKENLGYICDNTGDNISIKNSSFCELTATYWILKNDKSDIVGLTHYRRYFFKNIFSNSLNKILSKEDILKILDKNDIIVPKKMKFPITVKEQYERNHNLSDLLKCKEIIEEKYPDYVSAFEKVLNQKKMYTYNMFISSKEIYNNYYNWLFDILFEVEKVTDISEYTDYNKRLYGFLSERLFNVWIEKNRDKLKIKEVPVYNTEESITKQF